MSNPKLSYVVSVGTDELVEFNVDLEEDDLSTVVALFARLKEASRRVGYGPSFSLDQIDPVTREVVRTVVAL
ncbi:hypothetical protein BH09ACT9_BH09ACT9_00260 [soil metagenome]